MGVSASTKGSAALVSLAGISGVVDLLSTDKSTAVVERMDSSTNVIAPRTSLPLVLHEITPGEVWIGTLVFGVPFTDGKADGWFEKWSEAEGQSGKQSMEDFRAKYRLD